jgi:TRAP-type C4-dicarboxylate transport system substrate-binding protein
VWSSDPITREVAKVAGVSGVSKGVPDVLPALNTGQINTIFASPLACLSLQWYGKMNYRIDMPMGVTVGAIVVSKKTMDSLSPEHRQIVIDVNKKWSKRLIKKVRKSNKVALKILTKKGIKPVVLTAEEALAWREMGAKAQNNLKGKVYSAKALNEARKHARWKAP